MANLPRLAVCAHEFAASTKYVKNFNFERFCEVWKSFIEHGAGIILVLIDGDYSIVGMLGGLAIPEPYSGDLGASEMFWFVRDGHRGGGLSLYRAFEAWAREKGCVQIRMAGLSDSMPEKMDKIYRRLGFEPCERQYVKEL